MMSQGYGFWSEWELYEKVDFDGLNKLIIVYPHVTALDIRKDVWSAWVRWNDMDARGYDRWVLAMERTGLDTIPGGQTGDSYFLKNGWRLVVNLSKVAVSGVLFSRDFGSAYYTEDLVIQFPAQVSSVVNTVEVPSFSDQQSLQLSEIHGNVGRSVYIDTELVSVGNGYQQSPFNNITDAIDYAELNGIKRLVMLSDATIDRQLKNFVVTGIGNPSIDCNDQNLNRSEFKDCKLTGAYIGAIHGHECEISNLSGLNGTFYNSTASGINTAANNGSVSIINVSPEIAGQPWTINMNSGLPSVVSIHDSSGEVIVTNSDNSGDILHFFGSQGKITIGATNTLGSIVVGGNVKVDDTLNGGSTVDKVRITSQLIFKDIPQP